MVIMTARRRTPCKSQSTRHPEPGSLRQGTEQVIEQVELETPERPVLMRDYRPPVGEELWLLFPRGARPDQARSCFRREYGHDAFAVRMAGGRLAVGPVGPRKAARRRRLISPG
jgi:hypothetical protein